MSVSRGRRKGESDQRFGQDTEHETHDREAGLWSRGWGDQGQAGGQRVGGEEAEETVETESAVTMAGQS